MPASGRWWQLGEKQNSFTEDSHLLWGCPATQEGPSLQGSLLSDGGPAGNSKPCLLSIEACQVWSCPQLGQVVPPYPGAICPVTLGHRGSNREQRDGCRGGKTILKPDLPEWCALAIWVCPPEGSGPPECERRHTSPGWVGRAESLRR